MSCSCMLIGHYDDDDHGDDDVDTCQLFICFYFVHSITIIISIWASIPVDHSSVLRAPKSA